MVRSAINFKRAFTVTQESPLELVGQLALLGKGQSGAPAALPGLTPAWSRATRQGTWAFSVGPAPLAKNIRRGVGLG